MLIVYIMQLAYMFAYAYINCVQSWKRKIRPFEKQMPISRAVGNDESSSRALFDRRFGEIPPAKPLSESARFKIYRRRVIFAIPTRRSRGVCYSSESAESAGRSRARELHKYARTKRSCSCNEWSYVTLYPRAIVKLRPESVVISDRTKRQIIRDHANVVSDN